MNINRNSRLLRWAYLLSYTDPRYCHTLNGCDVFWRCVFLTPLKLTVIGAFIFMIGYVMFYVGWEAYGIPGLFICPVMTVAFFGFGIGFDKVQRWSRHRDSSGFVALAVARWRGFKEGYCPTITLTDNEN